MVLQTVNDDDYIKHDKSSSIELKVSYEGDPWKCILKRAKDQDFTFPDAEYYDITIEYSCNNYEKELNKLIDVYLEISEHKESNAPAVASASHTHVWTYGTIYDATENSDGLEGEHCSCGATRNTSVIPASDYIINSKYQQIDCAYPGKTAILEMNMMNSLSQAFMKKLASKNNCDFIIRFTYDKKHYEVYIPAGTKIDTSFEWYGPEKLMEMFAFKQLN